MTLSDQRKKRIKRSITIFLIVLVAYFAWNVYPTPYGYNKWMLKTEKGYNYYYEKYNRFNGVIVDKYQTTLGGILFQYPWDGKVPLGAEKI